MKFIYNNINIYEHYIVSTDTCFVLKIVCHCAVWIDESLCFRFLKRL